MEKNYETVPRRSNQRVCSQKNTEEKYNRGGLGCKLIKMLCYFSGFCDICGISQLFNMYAFLILDKFSGLY